jgi:hypothetical protein
MHQSAIFGIVSPHKAGPDSAASQLRNSHLLDACYLSAGDEDAGSSTALAELRTMINWLVGSAP